MGVIMKSNLLTSILTELSFIQHYLSDLNFKAMSVEAVVRQDRTPPFKPGPNIGASIRVYLWHVPA